MTLETTKHHTPRTDSKTGKVRCTKCREYKQKSEFSKNNSDRLGVQAWCKTCQRAHNRPVLADEAAPAVPQLQQPSPTPVAAVPVSNTESPRQEKPLFIAMPDYIFGVSSIALIDTHEPGIVELKLNIHEVNGKGYPEALSFMYEGNDAVSLLSQISTLTTNSHQIVDYLNHQAAELKQARAERDEALKAKDNAEKAKLEAEQRLARVMAALG